MQISAKTKHAETSNSAQTVTPPFPVVRFIFAICILLIGVSIGLYQTATAKLNPDPLTSGFILLSPLSWLHPLERNGVLRIPVIDTTASISRVATQDDNLALEFDSNQQVLLSPSGELSYIDNQSSEGISKQTVLANVVFDQSKIELSGLAKIQIARLFESGQIAKDRAGNWPKIKLYGYASGLQNQIQQESVSNVGLIKKGGKAELKEEEKLPEQQTAKRAKFEASPNSNYGLEDIGKKTSKELIELVTLFMSDISDPSIRLGTDAIDYGLNQHYDGTWLAGAGTNSGVVIEITQLVGNIQWLPLSTTDFELVTATENNWRLSAGILQFGQPDQYDTVAIFPAVLNSLYPDVEATNTLSAQRYPSPFALLIMIAATIIAVRVIAMGNVKNDVDIVEKQDLVDSFVSDAPISEAAQDKLGFHEISRALSRFMRNASTKAPLTLAITGVWGCGKSSMMHFLRQSLEHHHLKPVWVNAWHHQNEEQFLAGLLSAIQRKAVPPFWSSAGTLYRWNLLKMRWTEAPIFFFLALIVFLTSLGYLLSTNQPMPDLTKLNENALPYIGALVSAFSIIRGGMDRLSGMVKENYLSSLLRFSSRNLDLRANVGLREKFAREFKMLCNALGDSTLTIFIDDLDRCKESRIMDVMETINYLVTSGDCFIVVGLEKEPVVKAIASYYRQTHSSLDEAELMVKARRYLEKIVNIEIPVPTGNSDQFAGLVQEYKPTVGSRKAYTWVKPLFFAVACVASVFFGIYLSEYWDKNINVIESNKPQKEKPIAPKLEPGGEPIVDSTPLAENKSTLILQKKEMVSYDYRMTIPLFLIALLAVIIRVERYRQRKHIVENDSQPFLQAIASWATLMGNLNKTPRSIKRYVNRSRYLAMRNIESNANIKEENIVTLTALLEFVRGDDVPPIDSLAEYLPQIDNPELAEKIQSLIEKSKSVTKFKARNFEHWIRGVNIN